MIQFLAQATTQASQSAAPEGPLYQLIHGPFVLITIVLVVMYFTMIMPKRKQDRHQKQMLGSMKRGDEVTTIGGIIGKVVDPRDDRVLVKVDESSNTKIWFSRSAIARVTSEDAKAAAK